MPKRGITKNGMVTGYMVHDYLQKYAEDHDLLSRIRFNTFVDRVERSSRGWKLHLRDSTDTIDTEKLLVATGVTSVPSMPGTFSTEAATIPVIHSKELGVSSRLIESDDIRSITIVGASKSAYDAVYMLLSMGKQVNWLIRPDGNGPLAIVPADFFGFVNGIAISSTRLMTYLSPSILKSTGALTGFFQRSRVGRWCTNAFWNTITYLSNQHAGYAQHDHVAALKPDNDNKRCVIRGSCRSCAVSDLRSIFWANSGLGIVTLPDFWPRMHRGNVKIIRDNIDSIKGDTILLRGGQSLQTDWLALCTGWGDHYGMFDADLKAELGLPQYGKAKSDSAKDKSNIDWRALIAAADRTVDERFPFIADTPDLRYPYNSNISEQRLWKLYRRSIPIGLALKDDRSLGILGQIHTAQTPLVAEIQSFWTILYMLREMNLPDETTMLKEIAEWNSWTRKRYLSQGQKAPYAIYDFLSVSLRRSTASTLSPFH